MDDRQPAADRTARKEVEMVLAVKPTEELLREYTDALLGHGDFAAYFTPDVIAVLEGPQPQRFEGREAVRTWIEGAHALGEIRPRTVFSCASHAGSEWEFIRRDGVVVPYAVNYEIRGGQISALHLFFTAPIA
jgi:hypothetical protein